MNLHPDVLGQAAFLDKARSRRDLYHVIGLVEERFAVQQERERSCFGAGDRREAGGAPTSSRSVVHHGLRNQRSNQIACWDCGQSGHVRSDCPRREQRPGNAQRPGGRAGPGAHS
jgi:hypothetical protein